MILKTAKLSLPILIFWRNNLRMICQVWLLCLQSPLSSDNKIELNIHEVDLHIKRMLVHLLYKSILYFSYSDIILVYTPACVFYAISTLIWKNWNSLYCFQPKLGLFAFNASRVEFLLQFSDSNITFSLPKKWSRFWLRFPCTPLKCIWSKSSLEPYPFVYQLLSRSTYIICSRLLEIVTHNNIKHKHGYRFLCKVSYK